MEQKWVPPNSDLRLCSVDVQPGNEHGSLSYVGSGNELCFVLANHKCLSVCTRARIGGGYAKDACAMGDAADHAESAAPFVEFKSEVGDPCTMLEKCINTRPCTGHVGMVMQR